MGNKTYWEQAQEEEDREQEAYLSEYRKRREAKQKQSSRCLWKRLLASIRSWLSKME